jgi:hypothetical protein
MTLTKREKLLLFIMALFAVILAFLMLIILPLSRSIVENRAMEANLETQKLSIESKLVLEPTLITRKEEKLTSINESLSQIENPINAAQFERWVLPLTTKYNMRITSVNLSQANVSTPTTNQVLISEPSYRLKNLIQEFKQESDNGDFIPETQALLLKQTHTYIVTTTYQRYRFFLDEVTAWNTSVFIGNSSYNFGNSSATFSFDVYTIHKIDEEDTRDYSGDYLGGSAPNSGLPYDPIK